MSIIIHSGSLSLPVSPHSKFDLKMLQKHVNEAAEFVAQCKKENKSILDVCGERGDLYFLLVECLNRY
jgi:phosphoribosyl-ATP pyrophosphohydrolase